jgi:hypothetical protein
MDFAAYSIGTPAPKIFLKIKGRPLAIRPSVHFIAVLDTSGSMDADNRLTNCLDSLRFLTRFLTPTDHLSLITFSGQAETPLKAARMTSETSTQLEHILNRTYAMGGTNMSAAINCIQECIEAAPGITKTDVLFLTDGQANEGIVAIPALLQMVRAKLQNYPTAAVSTVGYSTDHNADLLRALAEQNAGSYNVVVDRESVASVFGVLLGGLMSCVGSNLQITTSADTVCLPANLRIVPCGEGVCRICVGDVYADAETQILLSLGAVPYTIPITCYDVATAEDIINIVNVVPATDAIQREAALFELRQEVAALLRRCSAASAEPSATLIAAIQELRSRLTACEESAMRTMLLRTLAEAEDVLQSNTLNNQTRVLLAQNSAYTGMGRGLRATVSAASTVQDDPTHYTAATTRSAVDEDPFASPVMRLVSGVTQALSIASPLPQLQSQPQQLPLPPSLHRQVARHLTPEEVTAAAATFPVLSAQPRIPSPPPLHRIQYATNLFETSESQTLPNPAGAPLVRQVAVPSRQTSNASDGQRIGFQSPEMSPIMTGVLPSALPITHINLNTI